MKLVLKMSQSKGCNTTCVNCSHSVYEQCHLVHDFIAVLGKDRRTKPKYTKEELARRPGGLTVEEENLKPSKRTVIDPVISEEKSELN